MLLTLTVRIDPAVTVRVMLPVPIDPVPPTRPSAVMVTAAVVVSSTRRTSRVTGPGLLGAEGITIVGTTGSPESKGPHQKFSRLFQTDTMSDAASSAVNPAPLPFASRKRTRASASRIVNRSLLLQHILPGHRSLLMPAPSGAPLGVCAAGRRQSAQPGRRVARVRPLAEAEGRLTEDVHGGHAGGI